MQIFRVGGCVRDTLMGLTPEDVDYVVVGATHEDMIARGFDRVGADFPVYLERADHATNEYALARTERKSGEGYLGFEVDASPEVTLEQDLARRDLTINSMAMTDDGTVVDPFHGASDIVAKTLRHTSEAFGDDPVRVLRLARFRARWGSEWKIAPETRDVVRLMGKSGVLDELQPDRVWKEFSRAMMSPHPRLFFDSLFECDVLHKLFPEVYKLRTATESFKWHPEGNSYEHTMLVLEAAARHFYDVTTRVAAVCHDLGKGETPRAKLPAHYGHEVTGVPIAQKFCERVGAPSKVRSLAVKATRWHMHMHKLESLNSKTILNMFVELDAWRDADAVRMLREIGICDSQGRLGSEYCDVSDVMLIDQYWDAARAVRYADVFPPEKEGIVAKPPETIKVGMYAGRLKALRDVRHK